MISECIKLLVKEIRQLNFSLEHALKKPHATDEEIANIEKKIRLKTEILDVVRGAE